VFGLKVLNDIDILRRNAYGDVPSLVAGFLQAFEDGSGRMYFKVVRDDGTTVKEAMAGEYFLREDLDFDGQTAVSFRVEDAAPLALSAANDGIISRDPTTRRLVKNGPVAGVRHFLSEFSLDGLSFQRVDVLLNASALEVTRDGHTGYLLDAGADEIELLTEQPIPFDYTEGHDCLLEVIVRLEAAESGTDSIDLQLDYEKAVLGADSFDGTETNKTDSGATLGAGTAAGTYHRVLIALTYNDASNPLAKDAILRGTLSRNGLTNVGDIVVMGANLLVPCYGGVQYQ
jgi:hypothetical protein